MLKNEYRKRELKQTANSAAIPIEEPNAVLIRPKRPDDKEELRYNAHLINVF
jgi:hypothetical protein